MDVGANEGLGVHYWRRYPEPPSESEPGPSSQPCPPQPSQPTRLPQSTPSLQSSHSSQPAPSNRGSQPPLAVDDSTVDGNALDPSDSPTQPEGEDESEPHSRPPSPPLDPHSEFIYKHRRTRPGKRATCPTGTAKGRQRLWNCDKQRVCIYAEMHPYATHEDIAVRFGVARSTISKILKKRHGFLDVREDRRIAPDYPKHKPGKFPDLELRLEEWTKLACKNGNPVSDICLRNKARAFADEMGLTADKFKASSGWVENFKHRVGIRRGFYVGNGTAATAIASTTALGSAPTTFFPSSLSSAPPPIQELPSMLSAPLSMPVAQPPFDLSAHNRDNSRTPDNPSPHPSVFSTASPSHQTWPHTEEHSPISGEISTPHAPGIPDPSQGSEFQPFHPSSPSAVAAGDCSDMPSAPHSTTSSSSEAYASPNTPAPAPPLYDQPIRSLQEADATYSIFSSWVKLHVDDFTADEVGLVFKIKCKLVEKCGMPEGRI